MIRRGTLDDATGAAALSSVVNPEFVSTGTSYRHVMATDPPESKTRWWCDERGGAIVAWASLGLVVETSEKGVAWLSILVHPDYRCLGIGTELSGLAHEWAATLDARRIHSWSRADEATVAFAHAKGFVQTNSSDLMTVDPRTITPEVAPQGIELRPLSDFADDPAPIHHVDSVSMLDEPGEITFDAVEYDFWLEHFWSNPLLDRDASTVAIVDGVPAVVTYLRIDRERGRATNNGTGTLPEFRGRGLATLAKRASLRRAAELGVTEVYTGNDVTNAPMQAVNRTLGYTACSTMLSWSKTLTT